MSGRIADEPAAMARATQQPDLAILLAASYRALTERLGEAMDADGIEGMRPSFGFVIRAVAAEEPTITRLAEMLDVTKQAASELANDAERDGFIERVAVPGDRRSPAPPAQRQREEGPGHRPRDQRSTRTRA